MEPQTHQRTVAVPNGPQVELRFTEWGEGSPVLLLHGGGGPGTVTGFAGQLAERAGVRVLVPTHPGFDGSARPDALATVPELAALYVALLEALDAVDVTVVGNSIGGWIAAEMATLQPARVARYVLVDAVGIEVADHPIVDFFALAVQEIADYSYYEPDRFRIDPQALPAQAQALMAGNRATLAAYTEAGMADPTLAHRLTGVRAPVLVVWGEADRIVDPVYGRTYADAIPGARFELLTRSGHLPQLETPQELIQTIFTVPVG